MVGRVFVKRKGNAKRRKRASATSPANMRLERRRRCITTEMILFVAKKRIERMHSLEIQPDVVFVRDSNAAVQLDRLLRDESPA